jgi:hypothetical protein
MIDDAFFDDVAAAFDRLRGWGKQADPRFKDLDRPSEMPLLAAAMTIAAAARLEAAIARLADIVQERLPEERVVPLASDDEQAG